MQVADALGISHELFQGLAPAARKSESFDTNTDTDETMQTLLELRLLRVFRELQQHDSQRMLIQLAEQIVKRQARARTTPASLFVLTRFLHANRFPLRSKTLRYGALRWFPRMVAMHLPH